MREQQLRDALDNLASVVKEAQRHVYLPVEIIVASDAVERAREAALASTPIQQGEAFDARAWLTETFQGLLSGIIEAFRGTCP